MMRLPLPAVFALLVLASAGVVTTTLYFKSNKPYVLDVSDLQRGQAKTVELDYIPYRIQILSNNSRAMYEMYVYINGVFMQYVDGGGGQPGNVCHNVCASLYPANTTVVLKPLDVRDTRIKVVVKYAYG